MKVSELTTEFIADYIRADSVEDYAQKMQIEAYLTAAVEFVKSYTGLTAAEIDTHEDVTLAVLVLLQDMYDNRTLYVEKSNINKVVDTILGMYQKNLL